MCEAGRILHHLKHNLWRPESHLLFVGYQADGTLGRRLLDGEKNVRIMGEDIVVRATIHSIGSYSAHADRDGLLAWLGAFKAKPRGVFLVHGEDQVLANWSVTVREKLGWQALVPSFGETYLLAEAAQRAGAAATVGIGDEWAELLYEVDAAYRGLRSRLPGQAPADGTAADRMRRLLQRVIKDMGKVS